MHSFTIETPVNGKQCKISVCTSKCASLSDQARQNLTLTACAVCDAIVLKFVELDSRAVDRENIRNSMPCVCLDIVLGLAEMFHKPWKHDNKPRAIPLMQQVESFIKHGPSTKCIHCLKHGALYFQHLIQ